MKVYLAARYSQKEQMKEYAQQLRELGVEVTSRWLEEPHAPNTTLDQVPKEELATYAFHDCQDISRADVLIFFAQDPNTPTVRGGRHVEFGIALSLGMLIWVVGPKENIFHYSSGVYNFASWIDLLAFLNQPEIKNYFR